MGRIIDVNNFLGPLISLVTEPYYVGRIWFTTWQAAVSTVLTLIFGLPLAYVFAKHDFWGKTFLKSVSIIPFVMPTIVVAMGFIALLGPQGVLNQIFNSLFNLDQPLIRVNNTLIIIFLAHIFYNYSIVVRIVSTVWSNLDTRYEEMTSVLGAGRIMTFIHVTLPLLMPAIGSAAILVFTFSFTSFGVVLILGGQQFATIEVTVYELATKLFRFELAGTLAMVQIMFTYIFMFIYAKIQSKTSVQMNSMPKSTSVKKTSGVKKIIIHTSVLISLVILLSPLLALIERAFSIGDSYSLVHFENLFSNRQDSYFYHPPTQVIWNSIRFATAAMSISLLIGTTVAYFIASRNDKASLSDSIFMMPLGISSVVMGFGFLMAFNKPYFDLRNSSLIIILAHSLVAYPFVIRSVLPVVRSIPQNMKESARILGASDTQTFLHIDIPIIMKALLVGTVFSFAVSMGEFGASVLITRSEFSTIPIAIYRFLSLPGTSNLGQALAMSCVLMAVVTTVLMVIERFRYKESGMF
ncbi:MAG: iron ABC transporter permease [Chloroflexota bacterium]|nr:iron ABC transporter permease [Chloroflexota bacterium]